MGLLKAFTQNRCRRDVVSRKPGIHDFQHVESPPASSRVVPLLATARPARPRLARSYMEGLHTVLWRAFIWSYPARSLCRLSDPEVIDSYTSGKSALTAKGVERAFLAGVITLRGSSPPISRTAGDISDSMARRPGKRGRLGALAEAESKVIVMRRPGALSLAQNSMPCSSATAATRDRPSPVPGVLMLRSSR